MSSENAVQNVDAYKQAADQGYQGVTDRLTDEKPGLVKRHAHEDADQGYEGAMQGTPARAMRVPRNV